MLSDFPHVVSSQIFDTTLVHNYLPSLGEYLASSGDGKAHFFVCDVW